MPVIITIVFVLSIILALFAWYISWDTVDNTPHDWHPRGLSPDQEREALLKTLVGTLITFAILIWFVLSNWSEWLRIWEWK